jgi:hypothetical protein
MVVVDVVLNSFIKFKTIIDGIEIDIVMFERFPEPFYPDIVQGTSFTVHGYHDVLVFEELGPQRTGVLTPLVTVENLRLAMSFDGIL